MADPQVTVRLNSVDNISKTVGGPVVGSLTELNSAISLIKQGMQMAQSVYNDTVQKFLDLADSVRLLSTTTGDTTEESSRLLEVFGKYGVGADQLQRALARAVKEGFDPTINGVIQLANKINAISDPTERATEMADLFGRSWFQVNLLIAKGGDALKAETDAVNANLVLTQKQVDQAQDLKFKLHDEQEAWDGLMVELGQAVVPGIVKALTTVNNLIGNLQLSKDALDAQKKGYIDYNERLLINIIADKDLTAGQNALNEALQKSPKYLAEIAAKTKADTEANNELTRETQRATQATKDLNAATILTAEELKKVADWDAKLAEGIITRAAASDVIMVYNQKMRELAQADHEAYLRENLLVESSNKVIQSLEDINKVKFTDLKSGLDGVINIILKLNDDTKYIALGADDVQKKWDAAVAVFGDKVPDAMKNSIMEQAQAIKVAAGDIKFEDAAKEMADNLGIPLKEAKTKLREFVDAAQIANGTMTYKQAAQDIANNLGIPLAAAKKILDQIIAESTFNVQSYVHIKYIIDNPEVAKTGTGGKLTWHPAHRDPADNTWVPGYWAKHGANFVVPSGSPNDEAIVHVSSGEHVEITPANQVSNTNNQTKIGGAVTNNYNLTIHSNSPIEPIIQDFAMLKSLYSPGV